MYAEHFRLVRFDLEVVKVNIASYRSNSLGMYAKHLRLVRFDLEVKGQGQTMEMANNFVNIAPRALECIGHL